MADKLLLKDGGCWYCRHGDGEMVFTGEFDVYVHPECLKNALRRDPKDREARIIARDIGYPAPVVAEGLLEIESVDDGGKAIITNVGSVTDEDLFFRFQSWDDRGDNEKLKLVAHARMRQLLGKKVRITLEVIE